MSLRIIIGRSGSGKTTTLMKEMKDQLLQNPTGHPIIYIVPEQMTFLSENKILSDPDINGMIRLNVYSLSRLALRILQETGGISRIHLNSTGIQMLIKRIINENKDRLRIFKQSADKFGFVNHVEKILTEMKRYLIQPEEIIQIQNEAESEPTLKDKLHDLELIFSEFNLAIQNKYLDSEDYLSLFAEKIPESRYLKNAEIYIDGFYSFTPQEYLVIEQLMKVCRRVTVALTLDQPYNDTPDELNLFEMTGGTYQTLMEIAEVSQVKVEKDWILTEQKRYSHPSLAHLEKYFDQLPAIPFEDKANIAFAEAANPRAEIEGIGRKIISLVRDSNYRYKDIAILLRNGETYHDLFETVFRDFGIPYYIDRKRSMLNHPLIELIRSTLEVITGYWRYDPVFRAIKTDLLFPLGVNLHEIREKMDRLENYCLAYGIQGERWTSNQRWHYRRFRGLDFNFPQTDDEKRIEDELNESRQLIREPMMRLSRRMQKAVNVQEMCTALFLYLEELEIPAKLEVLRFKAEEEGNLLLGRDHEQAWNGVLDLLDQFVEMMGDEQISQKEFAEIIEAGVESLHFTNIPPAIDQVVVADMELSRLSDIKVAFVIGLNEGVLPLKFKDDGILSDDDRESLLEKGLTIAPTSKQRLLDEEFIAYKTFTIAEDFLFLSYPLATEEGSALIPSPYIKRLKEILPNHEEYRFEIEPSGLPTKEQLEFYVNWDEAITYVTNQLQVYKRKEPIEEFWWDGYNLLVESDKKDKAMLVLSSLFHENKATRLSQPTVKQLYGEVIQGSISRMELFNSCAYAHFLTHGLRLREREIFRLEAPDIGELFHGALKLIGDLVKEHGLSWAKLTKKQIQDLVQEAMNDLAPKLQNEILLSSNRYQYLKRKLEKIIYRTTYVLSEHAKVSGFSPVGMEIAFGPKGDLPPVKFQLKNGVKMQLVGRIDRVDQAESDQGVFLRVIDYKSGNKDINLTEVYYGLALQMLTYLDILIRYSEELIGKPANPAGVLYFHIHNPLIRTKKPLSDDQIEEEILKRFKMNGLVLQNEEIVRLMDQSLDSGKNSHIISAGIKKDGQLTAKSKVASENEFADLRKYVQHVFEKTGNEIVEGKTDIEPYKLNDKIACAYCPFKSVCKFDPALKENNYRNLASLNQDEAYSLVKGVVGNGSSSKTN